MKQRPSGSSISPTTSASASASASSLVLLLKLQLISYILLLSFHGHVTITTALTISPTTMDDGRKFVLKYTLSKVQEENNKIDQEDNITLGPSGSCIHYKLPNPSDEEEDELEMLYPTSKSMFVFDDSDEVTVRTTSFGCGKLGFEIWTASIFLSLYCRSVLLPKIENNNADKTTTTTTIVEIGAGCGLPSSTLARYPSESQLQVIATDFWMEPTDEFDKERLIPNYYHGVNLKYNIEQNSVRNSNPHLATAKRLDWIDPKPFIDDVDNVDWVIGSDIIYYPQDLQYLWNTLEVFLKHGTKVIIAATADKKREALPDFINQLDAKQKSNSLKVNKEEWILYQQGTEDDDDDNNNGGIRETNRFYCFCFEKA